MAKQTFRELMRLCNGQQNWYEKRLDALTPNVALRYARLFWVLFFASFVALIVSLKFSPINQFQSISVYEFGDVLAWVAWLALPISFGVGVFGRSQVFKRHWHHEAVTPKGYVKGNFFFLMSLGVGMQPAAFGLMLASSWFLASGVLAIGVLIFVAAFPRNEALMIPDGKQAEAMTDG